MKRIGLDYDFRDLDYLRSVCVDILGRYEDSDLRVFISPSGRGHHVRFNVGVDYTDEDLLRIRGDYGDDPNRISMVENCYRDVLFDIKQVDGVTMYAREIDVDFLIKYGREVLL